MRAVAEAALREVQAKLADRDAQIAMLMQRSAEQQGAFLAQHQADRCVHWPVKIRLKLAVALVADRAARSS